MAKRSANKHLKGRLQPALLLSSIYQPLKVISWRRAVLLTLFAKVDVLEQYPQMIRSPSISLPCPAVLRLRRYSKPIWRRVKLNRHNLYLRDGHICQYCRMHLPASQLTYDHVAPRSKGGKTEWSNVVTACLHCNLKKGNQLLHQCGMKPLNIPREPNWQALLVPQADVVPPVWLSYLPLQPLAAP